MKATTFLAFFGITAAIASATSLNATFNFNSLAENATTTQIQNYMNGILAAAGCSTCTVTVTGAYADTTWNGGNHATGPGTGSKSLTLGDSDGATASTTTSTVNSSYDTFLATTNDGDTATGSKISMTFSGMTINGSSSFDYEIFPDVNCPSPGSCTSRPDFTFDVNGSTPVTSFGTNGVQLAVNINTTNGNATHSPGDGTGSETAPQFIGTWAGTLGNSTELDFIDWPATIGIDNLAITFTKNTPAVPEPVSVLLLGTAVAGLAMRKKFRKTA